MECSLYKKAAICCLCIYVDGIQATTHTNKGMYFCGKHGEFDCSSAKLPIRAYDASKNKMWKHFQNIL
jgi:hypothetical protein